MKITELTDGNRTIKYANGNSGVYGTIIGMGFVLLVLGALVVINSIRINKLYDRTGELEDRNVVVGE